MKILPKEYKFPQLTHLDFDTRLALWNYTLDSLQKYRSFDKISNLMNSLNNLIIRKPNDEILEWIKQTLDPYPHYIDTYTKSENLLQDIINSFIKPQFYLKNFSPEELYDCWDILQICEILVKSSCHQDFTDMLSEIAEAGAFIDQDDLEKQANRYAVLTRARGYNEILETYWVGYLFASDGNLLPVNSLSEQNLLEESYKLAEQNNWSRFSVHYLDAIKHAVGPNYDAKASIRDSISALEGLFIQHFDPEGTRTTLGTVLRDIYTIPVDQPRITPETYNQAKELWVQSNRNNTRHSNGDTVPELEEARKFLLDVATLAVHAMKSIANGSEIW